jgi:methionyl-tRNA formyltransferase
MPLRLIFMGTPDFAVPTLLELVAHGHEIAAVYTRAPKPGGRRGLTLQPTPVEQEARRLNIPVFTPKTLKTDEALHDIRAHNADAAVVVACGMILPQAILDAPRLGCFNLHASLLPRWRGAAPINRGTLQLSKQPSVGVTCAAKIEKAEARIDWCKPARSVLRHIHGLSPFPGAWCELAGGGEAARLKILRCELASGAGAPGTVLDDQLAIACGEGAIRIIELQRAGKAPMKAAEFLRGVPLKPPARLD